MPRWSRKAKRTETGTIRKKWKARASIALVFPNLYEVGMANLGFQRVYAILNSFDSIVCERIFWDGASGPTTSVESNRPLRDFDIICFSISFELDYLKIPKILDSQGIPCFAKDRGGHKPLVFAGGIAPTLNPEPIAHFMDAFFLGEFEPIARDFVSMVPELLDTSLSKEKRLALLVESIEGVYCPAFFHESHDDRERRAIVPPFCKTVEIAPMSQVITPDSVFGRMVLVETARGCGQGCRFCAAGFAYRPPRRWPKEAVISAIESARTIEADSIGLIGLEFIEEAIFNDLMEFIIDTGLRLSFSSLRADKISPLFASLLRRSGVKTATIAAEAGSERLRRVINKRLTEDDILDAATTLMDTGIPNLKVYFMLGLPTEDDGDVEAAVALIKKLRAIMLKSAKFKGRLGHLVASFSTFVPKPVTPFAQEAQAPIDVLKRRRRLLREALKGLSNVRLQLDSLRDARTQALISRGCRELAKAIHLSSIKGIGLEKAIKEIGSTVDRYLTKLIEKKGPIPWDFISTRVKETYLVKEYEKAMALEETGECVFKGCKKCGACEVSLNGRYRR